MPMTTLFFGFVALVLLHEVEASLQAYGFLDWRDIFRLQVSRRSLLPLAGLLVLGVLFVAEAGLRAGALADGGLAGTALLILMCYAAAAYRIVALCEDRGVFRRGSRLAKRSIVAVGASALATYAYAEFGFLLA